MSTRLFLHPSRLLSPLVATFQTAHSSESLHFHCRFHHKALPKSVSIRTNTPAKKISVSLSLLISENRSHTHKSPFIRGDLLCHGLRAATSKTYCEQGILAPSNRSGRTYYDTLGQVSEFLLRSLSPLTLVLAFSFVLLCLLVISTPFLLIPDSLNTFFDFLSPISIPNHRLDQLCSLFS